MDSGESFLQEGAIPISSRLPSQDGTKRVVFFHAKLRLKEPVVVSVKGEDVPLDTLEISLGLLGPGEDSRPVEKVLLKGGKPDGYCREIELGVTHAAGERPLFEGRFGETQGGAVFASRFARPKSEGALSGMFKTPRGVGETDFRKVISVIDEARGRLRSGGYVIAEGEQGDDASWWLKSRGVTPVEHLQRIMKPLESLSEAPGERNVRYLINLANAALLAAAIGVPVGHRILSMDRAPDANRLGTSEIELQLDKQQPALEHGKTNEARRIKR